MKLALITPAFSKHLPLLEISAENVDRNSSSDIQHFVVVCRSEVPLFRRFGSQRRTIVAVEDILPKPAFRLPFLIRGREVWLSERRRLIRGWIMQQAVKLCAPEITSADALLFLDTDVFFIRPFSADSFVKGGRVRLLAKPDGGKLETHFSWHRTAAKLLGLPPRDYFGADFIGNAITWRRDACIEMRDRMANVSGEHWFTAVTRQSRLSEYILYGIFAQEVLGIRDQRHFATNDELCLNSWDFMDDPGDRTQHLRERLRPNHIAINIQSNLHLSNTEMRSLVNTAITSCKAKV
jgi:hypothetical protein